LAFAGSGPRLLAADTHRVFSPGDICPDNRREYERTRFANDVAVRVVTYRAERGLSQTALARMLGMHQSAIARLEAGEHEPSFTMLSQVLGEDFSVDITPHRMELRSAAG
jgi:ribosome-binding protein aMBF1 (putative translation factor)